MAARQRPSPRRATFGSDFAGVTPVGPRPEVRAEDPRAHVEWVQKLVRIADALEQCVRRARGGRVG